MARHFKSNPETDSTRLSSKERLLASVATLMEIASHFTHKRNFKSSSKPPRKLMSTISSKAVTLMNRKKINGGERRKGKGEEEWGDGGVWQRSILMRDKCEPLDFSGVIYYDSKWAADDGDAF